MTWPTNVAGLNDKTPGDFIQSSGASNLKTILQILLKDCGTNTFLVCCFRNMKCIVDVLKDCDTTQLDQMLEQLGGQSIKSIQSLMQQLKC